MPMVYTLSPATAGNTATNGSANTESDVFFIKPGVRNLALQAMYIIGKGAGLTAISGIAMRVVKWATASTGGTSITATPKDAGMQAAKMTAASAPTAGSTRTQHVVFGCGAAGPGGWVAPNPDSVVLAEGGSAFSIDAMSVSGTSSLNFEFAVEAVE
jgi:hypothetical protein